MWTDIDIPKNYNPMRVLLAVSSLPQGFHHTSGDFPKPEQIHHCQSRRYHKQAVKAYREHLFDLKDERKQNKITKFSKKTVVLETNEDGRRYCPIPRH